MRCSQRRAGIIAMILVIAMCLSSFYCYAEEIEESDKNRVTTSEKKITGTKASSREKLYTKLKNKIESFDTNSDGRTYEIDVSEYGLTKDTYKNAIKGFLYSQPQLVYMSNNCSVYTKTGTNKITKIKLYLAHDKSTAKSMKKKIDSALATAKKQVSSSMTAEEKALAIHEYLASSVSYDSKMSDKHAWDLYGAMVKKKAVCEGYSEAYQYIMQSLGVQTRVATSTNSNHAWNVIKIGDKWYHVDVLFDDTQVPGGIQHNYFLLSTKTMLKETPKRKDYTVRDFSSVKYSNATSTKYENGFWVKSKSKICHYGGYWYYSDKSKFKIVKYNYKTKKSKNIAYNKSLRWKVIGSKSSYYTGSYSYLASSSNKLYYTTPTTVHRYDMKSGKDKTIAKSSYTKGRIYGIKATSGYVTYLLKAKPYGATKKTVKVKAN